MQTTKNKKSEQSIAIATRITEPMEKAIKKVLMTNAHLNVSDYLRDLIRKDLENRGILNE